MNYLKATSILGLSHDFTKKELKKKYRDKCLETHPDKCINSNNTSNNFIEVKDAYEFLSKEENLNHDFKKNENETRQNTMVSYIIYFCGIFLNILIHNILNRYKTIILKPTIYDIFSCNIYKLVIDNEIFFIPLWCDKICIQDKNIIVKIEKPDNIDYKYESINNSELLLKHICIDVKEFNNIKDNINKLKDINVTNNCIIKNYGVPLIRKVFYYDDDIDDIFNNKSLHSNLIISKN